MSCVRRFLSVILIIAAIVPMLLPLPSLARQGDGTPPPATAPCSDGRLRIVDLEGAQSSMNGGIDGAAARATDWESDARLVTLLLGCPLLETGFRWEGIFFSEAAQAYWHSGTDEIAAANESPDLIRTLVTDSISMATLHRSLLRAGFSDDLVIDVTNGVTIRYNTEAIAFGPPNAPLDAILFHVAIEQRGEIKDVWVSLDDGTVYRY